MQKRIVLLAFAGFLQFLASGQQRPSGPVITLSSDSLLYSGTGLTGQLSFQSGTGTTINSLIFSNGIIDTFYRYSTVKLEKKGNTRLELGTPPSPGLYFLQIDTVSDRIIKGHSAEHLYRSYSAFVHAGNDGNVDSGNLKNKYPLRVVDSSSLQPKDWILLDSLVSRINPDTITNRIDTLLAKTADVNGCDTAPPPSWEMAFILTLDSAGNKSYISLVLDSMGGAPIDTAGMINLCFSKFEYYLLDTTSHVADTTVLAKGSRQRLIDRLNTLKADPKRFDVYWSNGFVQQLFELNKQMDIRHVCEKYCLYRRKDLVEQLVFVMKVPVPH